MRRRIILGILLALLVGGLLFAAAIFSMGKGGEQRFGFVTGVTTNGNYGIIFDEAEWLTGEDAEDAAIAAGLCTEATRSLCVPNDYIISNPSSVTRTLEFATDIVIVMQTLGMEQQGVGPIQITRQDFERLINDSRASWRDLPYRITVQNNLVVMVEEMYVP